jgi:hypothetical protein
MYYVPGPREKLCCRTATDEQPIKNNIWALCAWRRVAWLEICRSHNSTIPDGIPRDVYILHFGPFSLQWGRGQDEHAKERGKCQSYSRLTRKADHLLITCNCLGEVSWLC